MLVFQSKELHLWDKTRKINCPGLELIFTTQDQNSGLFHGREQNFEFRAFSHFPGSVGTLAMRPIYGLILNEKEMSPEWQLNYTNPGYGLSLVDTLWNAGSYRQPLEQEGNPMT